MARTFQQPFVVSSSLAGAVDLCAITCPSGKFAEITRVVVSTQGATLPTAQQVPLVMNTLIPAIAGGTGGAAGTPQKNDPGDQAAQCTTYIGATAPNTGAGTLNHVKVGMYAYGGLDHIPIDPYPLTSGDVFQLQVGITNTVLAIAGFVEWREKGA